MRNTSLAHQKGHLFLMIMSTPSAEEQDQEEAPTAKKAKHEEQIRVRARDGEEVTLSRDAAVG